MGKVDKTVIRPAVLWGAETWASTKRQETQIDVNEITMLRWMCGVNLMTRSATNTSEGQKDHGETSVFVRACDGKRRTSGDESGEDIYSRRKEERTTENKTNRKQATLTTSK